MSEKLAIDGGEPVRAEPFPHRALIGEDEKAAALEVFDEAIRSGEAFGYNGPFEEQYERDFVEFMGGGYADAVNSGTNALFCALGALRLDALSEVIVPAITDPGGIMPVLFLGCVPVVADTDPRSYNTSAEQIEPLITERTRAIVVAHIGGEPVDMDPVVDLAKEHDLWLVEDAAQAHGARYKGELVGTIGDIAAFSTMFGKHHCTGGQGGIVYTCDEDLFWRAKRFADRGKPFDIEGEEGNVVAGLNCNSTDLAGAIGSAQLERLPEIIERRRRVGEAIKEGLADCTAVSVGWQVPETECVYWFLRLQLELDRLRVDKDLFCEALAAEGLPVTESYRAIPAERPWFTGKAIFGESGFPWACSDYGGPREPQVRIENAVRVTDANFNVALHENYGEREVADIVAALRKVEAAYLHY
ncbi:MAG: DegT/DnrJ/EryC1/StrS family aminotransferase [Planctomycetota bacterium]